MLEEYRGQQINQRSMLDEANIRSDVLVSGRVVELLGDVNELSVLELGSGNGKVARMLAQRGAHVTGVDLIQEQVDIASANSPRGIAYVQADYAEVKLPELLQGAKFDRVIAVMAFFYSGSDKIAQALVNVKKLLKPDGVFILGTASPYRGLKKDGFDYFQEQESDAVLPSMTNEPFKTRYVHLPLQDLLTQCLAHGFVLSRLIEPHATAEELQRYPQILSEEDLLRPDYLILEFKAPK